MPCITAVINSAGGQTHQLPVIWITSLIKPVSESKHCHGDMRVEGCVVTLGIVLVSLGELINFNTDLVEVSFADVYIVFARSLKWFDVSAIFDVKRWITRLNKSRGFVFTGRHLLHLCKRLDACRHALSSGVNIGGNPVIEAAFSRVSKRVRVLFSSPASRMSFEPLEMSCRIEELWIIFIKRLWAMSIDDGGGGGDTTLRIYVKGVRSKDARPILSSTMDPLMVSSDVIIRAHQAIVLNLSWSGVSARPRYPLGKKSDR